MSAPSPGAYLKARTAGAHRATEDLLLGQVLINRSISLKRYRDLIRTTHRVWSAALRELTQLPELTDLRPHVEDLQRALVADVALLQLPTTDPPPAPGFPPVKNITDCLGVYYVLLGSTLGGRVIAGILGECPALTHLNAFHFYGACAGVPKHTWPTLQKLLCEHVTDESDLRRCAASAESTFQRYHDWYPQADRS